MARVICEPGGSTNWRRFIQPVLPALPLRPVKQRPRPCEVQESRPEINTDDDGAPTILCSRRSSTRDHVIGIQFGQVGTVNEAEPQSPSSTSETSPSANVTLSTLLPNGHWPRDQQPVPPSFTLPRAWGDEDTAQTSCSRPGAVSSLSLSLDPSDRHQRDIVQSPVVQLPADVVIPDSSKLNISFLYDDTDPISRGSNQYVDDTKSSIFVESVTATESSTWTSGGTAPYNNPFQSKSSIYSHGSNSPVENRGHCLRDQPFSERPAVATKNGGSVVESTVQPSIHAAADPTDRVALSTHLLHLFDGKILWDQQVVIRVDPLLGPDFSFFAHKIMILRAPGLVSLISPVTTNEKVLIGWPMADFAPSAFRACLRYLYGDRVLGIDDVRAFVTPSNSRLNRLRRDQLIFIAVYWLGGLLLDVEAITHQAEKLMQQMMDFDIVAGALETVDRLRDHQERWEQHGHQSSLACIAQQQISDAAQNLSGKIKHIVFDFIALNINFQTFHLDTYDDHDPGDYHQHSRFLQKIQFGQLPRQETLQDFQLFPAPTRPSTGPQRGTSNELRTSKVLLSLSPHDLKDAISIIRHTLHQKTNQPQQTHHQVTIETERIQLPTHPSDPTVERRDLNVESEGVDEILNRLFEYIISVKQPKQTI